MSAVLYPVAANAEAALAAPQGRAAREREALGLAGEPVQFVREFTGPVFKTEEAALDAYGGRVDDPRPGRLKMVAPEDRFCELKPIAERGMIPFTGKHTAWRLSVAYWRTASGEALRLQNLPVDPHSESWASKAVDWLEQQSDVNPGAIGMTGISLGGHFAPRAVAYEPRFASGAVWGANHNWAEVQQKRLKREGENPVPHYWAHVMWVFGATDMDDLHARSADMHLNGVMERIAVPFLVTHGAEDRQISVDYAHQSHDQLTNSPRRELKIFTAREGGVEHVGADNMSFGRDYIADWFADTLGGHVA